jgi:sirohydrochlorin ferrochelatase
MSVNRSGYMTLREGASWLGMGSDRNAARRLYRLLRAKEREFRVRLLHRTGGGHYRVTRAQLKRYCREQWSRRDEILGVVRTRFEAIDERLRRTNSIQRGLGARIRRNSKEIKKLRDTCTERKNVPQRPATSHPPAPVQ